MKTQRTKFYNFLSLFNDNQEQAIYAIRDLTDCTFRTAKIRTIVTNIKFDGISENFSEIEEYIDVINEMITKGFDTTKFIQDKKYKNLNDDEIFKIEELDEVGLENFKEELSLLSIEGKVLEYLYFRETAFKEKANKEISKLKEAKSMLEYRVRLRGTQTDLRKYVNEIDLLKLELEKQLNINSSLEKVLLAYKYQVAVYEADEQLKKELKPIQKRKRILKAERLF